jgi:hypothetical protein
MSRNSNVAILIDFNYSETTLIHLNQEIIVYAPLPRVESVRCKFFFNESKMCCLLMILPGSIEISKKTWLTTGNSRSSLQMNCGFVMKKGQGTLLLCLKVCIYRSDLLKPVLEFLMRVCSKNFDD